MLAEEEGFSHKALDVILEALRAQAERVDARHAASDPDLDAEWGDRANDLRYMQILIAEVEGRIERLVARLGTSS